MGVGGRCRVLARNSLWCPRKILVDRFLVLVGKGCKCVGVGEFENRRSSLIVPRVIDDELVLVRHHLVGDCFSYGGAR